jgi:hypothetical protein
VTRRGARILGGAAGMLLVLGWLLWRATRPAPCSGAVFVEFAPPLAAPGPYRFVLTRGGGSACTFEVPLPLAGAVDTSACDVALDLTVRGEGDAVVIAALTVGAAPRELTLRVERAGEVVYDARMLPEYAEYPARREDDPRFCGARAHVAPDCRRGSSQCAPFTPRCRGPGDCAKAQVCCVDPLLAREHGVQAATRCTTRVACESTYGALACLRDRDCPGQRACEDQRFRQEFEPPVTTCLPP